MLQRRNNNGSFPTSYKKIKDHREALDIFEKISLPAEDEKTQEIIMNFPTVYIHNWMESGYFEVYVGESNDIFKRTRQHYDSIDDTTKWQNKLLKKDATLFIIGHEHFNKSLTLDIENRLMHYMMSADRVKHVYNLRDNPQKSYYPMEELEVNGISPGIVNLKQSFLESKKGR